MKSRERVVRAIELSGPDRPPISHGILPAAAATTTILAPCGTCPWRECSGSPWSGHFRIGAVMRISAWITFFEQLQQLRGMENLMMDLAEGSREIFRLRDDLLAFNLRCVQAGV